MIWWHANSNNLTALILTYGGRKQEAVKSSYIQVVITFGESLYGFLMDLKWLTVSKFNLVTFCHPIWWSQTGSSWIIAWVWCCISHWLSIVWRFANGVLAYWKYWKHPTYWKATAVSQSTRLFSDQLILNPVCFNQSRCRELKTINSLHFSSCRPSLSMDIDCVSCWIVCNFQ